MAFKVLFSDTQPMSAFEATFGFLWYWHMTFAVLKVLFGVGATILGVVAGSEAADTRGERLTILSLIGVGTPLLMILLMINSLLFLGGVYAWNSGVQAGQIVNQNHFVVGCILYGLACLSQMRSASASSSSKKD